MARKNRLFAKMAGNINTDGDITSSGISSAITTSIDEAGVTIYASAASLPTSGNTAGDQAFATDTNRLYIYSGVGWYNVALINNTPIIQSVLDSDSGTTPFSLAIDGTPTTITITAVDSDGETITYASSADSDFSGLATLSQSSNVFTITPLSQDSATTSSGTITFTATDGINTATSGVQTFTLNFLSALWDETVLSVGTSSTNSLANSTFIDRSSNGVTIGITNTPVQTAFHPYLDEWSVEFSQGYQRFLQNTSIPGMGTSDFTIEAWIWHNGDLSENQTIFANAGTTSAAVSSISFQLTATNGYLQLGRYFKGNSTGTTAVPARQWVHVAVERSGSNVYLYVNGVQQTKTIGADESYGFTGGFRIGEHWDTSTNSGQPFGGFISNLRVVKGSLVYNGSFTPPTEKLTAVTNTVLLTCQDNRFKDNSTNDYALTINDTNGEGSHDNPKISAFNSFGQGSEYATGANKGSVYLDGTACVESGSTINPSSGCCIEGWMYLTTVSSYGFIFSTEQGNVGFYPRWYVGHDNSGNWRVSPGDATDNNLTSYPVTKNQWNHWALTNDGSTSRLFVNGKLIYTKSVTPTSETLNINISKYGDTHSYGFYGYISDFRAATTIPTAYQTSSTTLDTQVFTPPTSPGGASGAGYYVPMDNAGIYDKTGNKTLTISGNVSTSTTQTKFANTSISFGGTAQTDHVSLNSTISELGIISAATTQKFTIEAWIYMTQNNANASYQWHNACIFGDGPGYIRFGIDSNNKLVFYHYSGSQRIWTPGSNTINLNTWHHVAICHDGSGGLKTFVDGTQDATGTFYGLAAAASSATTQIGTSGFSNANERSFQGYIENFQLLLNTNKYTGSFTAPTQEQGRSYQSTS